MNMLKGITFEDFVIIVLGVGYIVMFVYIFIMNRRFDNFVKHNNIEHTKLYKNQKSITTELSQMLSIVRNIKDDIKANSQLLKKRIDDYSDTNKIIKSLRQNNENAQKKIEKYEQLIKTLTNRIIASNAPKNGE